MDVTASGLLDYVQAHREWAGWVVFSLSVIETTPFLSTLIPSTPFIVGLGVMISTGTLQFLPIFLGAVCGAVAGSTLAWWVGLQFGPAILTWGPVARRPDWIDKATRAMHRWGIWAVTLAHVFAPLTSLVFLFAGITRIPFWRFQMATIPGAAVWAYLIPKTGEWGGDLAQVLWTWFTGV